MPFQRKVITVDGLAGSGKTSISRALAKKIGFVHFNSGTMYRVAGLLAMEAGISLEDEAKVIEALSKHTISMDIDKTGEGAVRLDNTFFAQNDRLVVPEVSEAASMVAKHAKVREYLKDQQRTAFSGRSIVAEGRDMGTVIFPDADLKFYIEASADVRAERRLAQLISPEMPEGEKETVKKTLKIEILERDERDQKREAAPAVAAKDAIIIENNTPSLTQIVDSMYDFITQKGLV